jgi:predicted secreted Zn-dependent protease
MIKEHISRATLFFVACLFAALAVIAPAGAQVKSKDQQADTTYSITGHPKGNSELLHGNIVTP